MPEMVLLTVAGLQLPVMPLVEVVGNIGATEPLQKAGMAAKDAAVFELTVIFKVAVVAHCPALGVKVYMPEAVLLTVAGLQVPVILLREVSGSIGATAPLQKAGMAVNVGVALGVTVIFNVTGVAH
jgi:hypothetical protein